MVKLIDTIANHSNKRSLTKGGKTKLKIFLKRGKKFTGKSKRNIHVSYLAVTYPRPSTGAGLPTGNYPLLRFSFDAFAGRIISNLQVKI